MVEPGVISLHVACRRGMRIHYAPTPRASRSAPSAGTSFQPGGAHCLKYGMTANHVLGLKAVLATGGVELGAQSQAIEPDWTGLFVEAGPRDRVEITLRCFPLRNRLIRSWRGTTGSGGGRAVARIVAAGLLPAAMEIMDAIAIEAATAAVHTSIRRAQSGADRRAGGAAGLLEAERRRLDDLIRESGAIGVHTATSPEERAAIWRRRRSAFSAVGRISPDYLVQDGVVLAAVSATPCVASASCRVSTGCASPTCSTPATNLHPSSL